jgi:hypothetical protein
MSYKHSAGLFNGLAIVRDKVRALPKTKAGHGYNYTPLDEILDYLRPTLEAARLVVIQEVCTDERGNAGVETRVIAEDGGEACAVCYAPPPPPPPPEGSKGPRMSPIQRVGSEITYLRRYGLCALLGLASGEDTDGYQIADTREEASQKAVAALKVRLIEAGRAEDAERVDSMTSAERNALWKETAPRGVGTK